MAENSAALRFVLIEERMACVMDQVVPAGTKRRQKCRSCRGRSAKRLEPATRHLVGQLLYAFAFQLGPGKVLSRVHNQKYCKQIVLETFFQPFCDGEVLGCVAVRKTLVARWKPRLVRGVTV